MVVGMPVRVLVSAEGYERRVSDRVVAALRSEAVAEAFRLDPLDPSKLRPYRGRLKDSTGKPVVGAQVRLIAARDRDPDQRAGFPFNWTMIKTGQLAQQPNVVRFFGSFTDAKGLFQFSSVPKGIEVELAWWGKGIAPGRADHLERVAVDRDGWLDISLPAPARIVGIVDRKSFTTAGRIQVSPGGGFIDNTDVELKPDQAEFAIDDLAPGEYTVSLTTSFERLPNTPGGLTTRTLATKKLTVSAGKRPGSISRDDRTTRSQRHQLKGADSGGIRAADSAPTSSASSFA